ncbi:hypothetical protein [Parasitella parasitica]|uniref:Tc1-like transposase DDE domain-containing protein n=1 Tax=Parasitella parasitica TaxID=35722 RepID=A0A0B7MT91_9FUNG|nr:hypothetical protein [Parasitella parasitica]
MSMQFLYENGQGRVVDEHGVEPINLVVDEELFAIETLSSRTQFLKNKPPERPSNPAMHSTAVEKNSEDIFSSIFSKSLSASAVARQLGIHVRAAQRWVKRYYEDPESIFERKKKSGRHRILGEEHKQCLVNYIDENPSAVLIEVVEHLMQSFVELNVSSSTVYNFTTTQWAISATGLINVSLRVPKRIKKRKLGHETNGYSIRTVTGHYLSFLKATLDEMDKYLEIKGHYLVMDNAPIHSSTDIGKYIHCRGYRYVYLPPYSPELNPIEQYWSVVKSTHLALFEMSEMNNFLTSDFEEPIIIQVDSATTSEQTGLMPVVNYNEFRVNKFLNGFNQQLGMGKEFDSIEQLREAAVAYGKDLKVLITTADSSFARGVITLQCKHGGVYRAAKSSRNSAASDDVAKRATSTSPSLCPMQIVRGNKLGKIAITKSVGGHSHPLAHDVRTYAAFRKMDPENLNAAIALLKKHSHLDF